MTLRPFKHVFGPVPSRRLGRSLGIDLVPFKTCTYDCIYCQLGRTTRKTIERKDYVPVQDVLYEFSERMKEDPKPDYVTLSGSGEPTLHKDLGLVIQEVKRRTNVPVAVLTNGSLLWQDEIRHALLEADVVLPSLDAGDARLFKYVNRADPAIVFDRMIEGLEVFRRCFKNQIWLEVFLLGGVTSLEREVRKIALLAARIAPDRVQLNTVFRPPAEEYAFGVSEEVMLRRASLFEPPAQVIADFEFPPGALHEEPADALILDLIARRPCTASDVADGLQLAPTEAIKHLARLVGQGSIRPVRHEGRNYYIRPNCQRNRP